MVVAAQPLPALAKPSVTKISAPAKVDMARNHVTFSAVMTARPDASASRASSGAMVRLPCVASCTVGEVRAPEPASLSPPQPQSPARSATTISRSILRTRRTLSPNLRCTRPRRVVPPRPSDHAADSVRCAIRNCRSRCLASDHAARRAFAYEGHSGVDLPPDQSPCPGTNLVRAS